MADKMREIQNALTNLGITAVRPNGSIKTFADVLKEFSELPEKIREKTVKLLMEQ